MKKGVILLVLLCGAAPALAQVISVESNNPLPKGPVTGDLDRIICESVHRTGSRLEVDKVCMTAAQWKDHQDGHRADVEKVQQVVNQSPSH